MGESLGQWKARPNSSNWDTLPSTLVSGKTQPVRIPVATLPQLMALISPLPAHCSQPGRQVGIPVVLRCVLVSQYLQVDGLRPSLDAPVLGHRGSRGERRELKLAVYCPPHARPG